jgi:predicted SAM-dependent methyltransferase
MPQPKRINIGSGHNPIIDGDNCDIAEGLPGLTFVCPMTAIPVADGTYDEVLSIHSIEHVPIPKAREALREWFRILKQGGKLHIDTPNIERNIALYRDHTWMRDFDNLKPEEKEKLLIDGAPNRTLWLNFKIFSTDVKFDSHYWNADPELLQLLCREAGFSRTIVHQTDPSVIVFAYKD